MKLRRYFRIIHRDFGYLFFALVIIYSLSGIAVNHVDKWNPNYKIEKSSVKIKTLTDSSITDEALIKYVIKQLTIEDSIKSSFRSAPFEIRIFMENKTIDANVEKGIAKLEVISSRRFFRESNYLHLNNAKKAWTYVADYFAVSLILLAITGLFMVPGKNGLGGRGKYLVILGILVPVIFLLVYFY